jgi:tRNA(fMet)-specific endonuclease VapC
MTGRNILLDTNVVIPILNRDANLLQQIQPLNIYIPSIVLGELYYGARHSGKIDENLARINTFRERTVIIPCNATTADFYQQGHPIPENDIWIAAIARQHDIALATRDMHFDQISDLLLERW